MSEKTLSGAFRNFVAGLSHFYECVDFNQSALDAEAIRWMNEGVADLLEAVTTAEEKMRKDGKNG